jgi:hypothetical protein
MSAEIKDKVIEYANKGKKAKEISASLGLTYHKVWSILTSANLMPKREKLSPQHKAHLTMDKDRLIRQYLEAKTTGIKASISREYKKTFGSELKLDIPTFEGRNKVKEALRVKEFNILVPKPIREMFDAQNKRIEALEKMIANLSK